MSSLFGVWGLQSFRSPRFCSFFGVWIWGHWGLSPHMVLPALGWLGAAWGRACWALLPYGILPLFFWGRRTHPPLCHCSSWIPKPDSLFPQTPQIKNQTKNGCKEDLGFLVLQWGFGAVQRGFGVVIDAGGIWGDAEGIWGCYRCRGDLGLLLMQGGFGVVIDADGIWGDAEGIWGCY